MPLLRLMTGGPGWMAALDGGLLIVPSFDFAVLLGGVLCIVSAVRRSTHAVSETSVAEAEAEAAA